ncbi:GNAT family N-acetyltransferase [Planobispora siamensis]|uniref:Acyl-CoA synthetase n=1 Tax=Planobispora siamensis TaxID=936338 RepID=A0A8J3SNI6_9ACTN|nr:bifunctional GNAT family N-acetyltransferase/acetate--CoA ligase family protein [Planobispora siamensis]GIH95770.1 acyl-CoA synthetase [Planobispora siamensis]
MAATTDSSPVPEPSANEHGEYDVLLRDGGIAHVRPLRPGDRAALHGLADRISERSAYLRFFTGGAGIAHRYMDQITGPGRQGHALVALVRGRVAGIAEYFPDGEGRRAELAVLLDDTAQSHGLGTLLLEHLALDAAEHGIHELTGDVLPDNMAMIHVLRDIGMDVELRFDSGVVRLSLPLSPPAPGLQASIDARDHEAGRASLTRLLSPRSVAVIGASRDRGAIGHRVLRNLVDGGFPGPIHPVNPRARRVAGLPCHPGIRDVPGPVDLAVVAVPARHVLDVARECAEAGVAGLVVLTAGFAESGDPDAEKELLRICRRAGMRLVGPNCLGIASTAAGLNATFLGRAPVPGRVGLMSQSGAVAAGVVDRLGALGLGLSSFVSAGNKADVSGNDLLEYWEDDEATDVIALYLESFGNPRKFARIARRVGARKPILLVKSGRSASGDRAVRSHTAAAATPDIAVEALVRASGVIRVDGVSELLDTALLLATQPLPGGPRVAIVGNSGGPEAMAADACERQGLTVPPLCEPVRTRLAERASTSAALGNPVDLTAAAGAREFGAVIKTVLGDPGIDAVLVVYTPPFGSGLDRTRKAIADAARHADKTVLACVVGHDGLIGERVPGYAFPEQAVAALARAVRYARWRDRPAEEDALADRPDDRETARAAREFVRAQLERHPEGCWPAPEETAGLLRLYGLNVIESVEVDGPDEAAAAAARIAGPVALKATGPELVHKSDVGGVRLGLGTPDEVRRAYREMALAVGPAMTGAVVQPMLDGGVETIVGGVNYPAFGPLVMVGMGGVAADLLADRAFRVPPITPAAATEMIGELRCSPLLYGYRGRPPVDAGALAGQIAAVGRLLEDLPDVAELDLNPVIVTADGAVAVDVKVRLAPGTPPPSPLRRSLR